MSAPVSHPIVEAKADPVPTGIHKYTGYANVQGTMDFYWTMGDNYHNGVINIDKYPVRIRLITYGLSQQAKFGDLPKDQARPGSWNLKACWKYDAWAKQSARPRTDARKDFIMLTEAILAVQGSDKTLKEEGQKYLDNVQDITNNNVNPGFVDNTMKFRDEEHVLKYLEDRKKM